MVSLSARVIEHAAIDGVVPLIRPVSIPIRADAVRAGPRLPVLAPEAVGGLSVDEAYRGLKGLVNDGSWRKGEEAGIDGGMIVSFWLIWK